MSGRVCERDGCGESLEGRDEAARFCSDRCRAAHWKAAHNYGRHDPPRGRRRGATKRRPEPRVNYLKLHAAVGDALAGQPEEVAARVREAMESCLSENARKAVASAVQ